MHVLLCTLLASVAAAEIFKFPLADGFPNVTAETLKAIEHQAGGPFPSGAGGTTLSPQAAAALQALAYNEIFEVAFFTELLQNITQSRPGYELGADREQVIAAVQSSQAQEEIHYLLANMGLEANNDTQIQPCEYEFPVNNFEEAVHTADDFTGMLMGAVPAVTTIFGGTPLYVTLFGSILDQEGEQDGYLRWLGSRVPNQNAFLTSTTLSLLYNHIEQNFVVPGSCPQKFNLPKFNRLLPLVAPPPNNSVVSFRTTEPDVTTDYYVAYLTGQIAPVVVPISHIAKGENNTTEFQASFPFESEDFSRGLIVATLVSHNASFADPDAVANATLAGPALIQVDYE